MCTQRSKHTQYTNTRRTQYEIICILTVDTCHPTCVQNLGDINQFVPASNNIHRYEFTLVIHDYAHYIRFGGHKIDSIKYMTPDGIERIERSLFHSNKRKSTVLSMQNVV